MQLQFLVRRARTAILAMAVIVGALLAGHGTASANPCSSYAGKELYNCLATKLDKASVYTAYRSPEAQRALQTAASQLRAATNKSQALSAISQCRSVITGIINRVRSAGQDNSGLASITGTLASAARLIQEKG
jgi:hypothetical protein